MTLRPEAWGSRDARTEPDSLGPTGWTSSSSHHRDTDIPPSSGQSVPAEAAFRGPRGQKYDLSDGTEHNQFIKNSHVYVYDLII